MLKYIFLLISITKCFSQKTSWGLIGGGTKSFEFHRQNNSTFWGGQKF